MRRHFRSSNKSQPGSENTDNCELTDELKQVARFLTVLLMCGVECEGIIVQFTNSEERSAKLFGLFPDRTSSMMAVLPRT
jgi:hypothetical protein